MKSRRSSHLSTCFPSNLLAPARRCAWAALSFLLLAPLPVAAAGAARDSDLLVLLGDSRVDRPAGDVVGRRGTFEALRKRLIEPRADLEVIAAYDGLGALILRQAEAAADLGELEERVIARQSLSSIALGSPRESAGSDRLERLLRASPEAVGGGGWTAVLSALDGAMAEDRPIGTRVALVEWTLDAALGRGLAARLADGGVLLADEAWAETVGRPGEAVALAETVARVAGSCPSAWPAELTNALKALSSGPDAPLPDASAVTSALDVCLDRALPAPPSNPVVVLNRGSAVTLGWTDRSTDEDAFRVELRPADASPDAAHEAWRGQVVAADRSRTLVGDLTPGTAYVARVRGCADAAGTICGGGEVLRFEAASPPAMPTGFRLVEGGAVRVGFVWEDRSTNEESFEILWQRPDRPLAWTPRTKVRAGITEAQVHGLRPERTYAFRLRACNLAGCSEMTEAVEVTTRAFAGKGRVPGTDG